MIIYRELRWGNCFSYGPINKLRLDENQITQIVGKNGHGKSSIGLILEEVQYNTNSKKMKKSAILNRYGKSKNYFIELDFEKDGDLYTIETKRTNTSGTVKLTCNGIDISSHTATATYKQIELVLGQDFTKFGQIVYQSSLQALEFLTATDTARKAFLIELFDLSEYTKALDVYKKLSTDISKQVDATEGKISTVSSWLKKYEKEDLTLAVNVEEPESPDEMVKLLNTYKTTLLNIVSTNKKISTNNTYKQILEGIELPSTSISKPSIEMHVNVKAQLITRQNELKHAKSHVSEGGRATTTCPTCKQSVDNSFAVNRAKDSSLLIPSLEADIASLNEMIKAYALQESAYQSDLKKTTEWEKYHALVDPKLTTTLVDKENTESLISQLEAQINETNAGILAARKINKAADEKNSKIKVISEQMVSMQAELAEYQIKLASLTEELTNLQILVKAFSSTGLVAYKIEGLVKDLEEHTNKYLSELADGRFQLSFRIASADKLNVVITDNGEDIEITALSMGERARVNVSTLLAIRTLMQGLSNSRTNLLILDETVENLDAEGKEKLIEVLLKEESLNTFLISHGFTHPLLEKINVVKTNNISRIE